MFGGALDERNRLLPPAVLEQEQAVHRLRLDMPRFGRLAIITLRGRHVLRDAAAEPVGMAEIEGGIGIAARRQRLPRCDGAVIVAMLPGLDSGLHRLRGERGGDGDGGSGEHPGGHAHRKRLQ